MIYLSEELTRWSISWSICPRSGTRWSRSWPICPRCDRYSTPPRLFAPQRGGCQLRAMSPWQNLDMLPTLPTPRHFPLRVTPVYRFGQGCLRNSRPWGWLCYLGVLHGEHLSCVLMSHVSREQRLLLPQLDVRLTYHRNRTRLIP